MTGTLATLARVLERHTFNGARILRHTPTSAGQFVASCRCGWSNEATTEPHGAETVFAARQLLSEHIAQQVINQLLDTYGPT